MTLIRISCVGFIVNRGVMTPRTLHLRSLFALPDTLPYPVLHKDLSVCFKLISPVSAYFLFWELPVLGCNPL
jgi:hypothetical protein